MKLFLQKKCKIFDRWGLRLQTPETAPPPLRISGYAPVLKNVNLVGAIFSGIVYCRVTVTAISTD